MRKAIVMWLLIVICSPNLHNDNLFPFSKYFQYAAKLSHLSFLPNSDPSSSYVLMNELDTTLIHRFYCIIHNDNNAFKGFSADIGTFCNRSSAFYSNVKINNRIATLTVHTHPPILFWGKGLYAKCSKRVWSREWKSLNTDYK